MVFNLPEEPEILLSDESNRFLKFAKKFSPVFLTLAIFSALSVSVALVCNFDEEIGHFSRGSVWFYLLCALTVISAISSAVFAILSSKKISLYKEPGEDLFSLFASVLCALVSAAAFIFFLISLPGYSVSKNLLQILSGLLLVFLAAGVFISVFPKYKSSPARAVLILLGCVAVNLDMFARYFDFTLPLNSPIRNLETIMQACALLFLLSEARLTLGAKAAHNTAKFYIFTSAAALHQATVDITKESERGIVDIETLTNTNEELIKTLDEVQQIQKDGREKRIAAEAELNRIEDELKSKLINMK